MQIVAPDHDDRGSVQPTGRGEDDDHGRRSGLLGLQQLANERGRHPTPTANRGSASRYGPRKSLK